MGPMAKSYRPWAPTQSFLLPPSPLEWLEEGHLAYFVLDVVTGSLDLASIERTIQAKDWRGERPYAPTMMVALLIYAYSVGVFSSRKMARATYEDVPFRVLAGGEHPHFTTINQFRLDHRAALADLFVQVLRLCRRAGLVKLGHVSFDGSKVHANASKHKAMSYKRMQEEEKKLAAEVEALLKRADETDRQEDDRYGAGKTSEDLPAELRRREDRLSRIREAKAALEREAAQARAEALLDLAEGMRNKADDETVPLKKRNEATTRATHSEQRARELTSDEDEDDGGPSGSAGADDLPRHRVPVRPDGTPKPNAQRNFTDPDSRIMVTNGAVVQAYNAQIAVDAQAQVIIAVAVTNQPPDPEHLAPMLERVIENCGQAPDVATADNGFLSQAGMEACARRGVDAYISLGRDLDKAAQTPDGDPSPAKRLRHAMALKLRSDAGKRIYARRKAIVEPPLGQIKQARGFRRFSFRGLCNVRHEWSFVALTHNLLKLFRSGWAAPQHAG
jgi:transposase